MNLCEATQNELCLLLDQENPPLDLRDHLAKCLDCRAFAAKLRLQGKQLNSMAYPESPNWEAMVRGKGDVHPATSPNLARKERTLGKIAVAFALAASLLLLVVGLLTQFKNNSENTQFARSDFAPGESTPSGFYKAESLVREPATNATAAKSAPGLLQTEIFGGKTTPPETPRIVADKHTVGERPMESAPIPLNDLEKPGQTPNPAALRMLAKGPDDAMNRKYPGGGPSKDVAESGAFKTPAPTVAKMTAMGADAPKPVLVPERVKVLRNLLEQHRSQAVALAKGEKWNPGAGTRPGAKPDVAGNKPKSEAIVNDYERLVGSNLPNLLASLSNLPSGQLSIELKPLLEHLQSSESEYSRLAAQYPTDGEWLRQIALLARVGILQIRTIQKEI